MTEADRVRAWRDKKRGRQPRPYHRKRTKGERQFGGPAANLKRAAAIRAAWDDPLLRAMMREIRNAAVRRMHDRASLDGPETAAQRRPTGRVDAVDAVRPPKGLPQRFYRAAF